MKKVRTLIIICLVAIISGCTSYNAGEVRSSYSPVAINVDESNNKAVTIKTADDLIIWKVDNKRKVNALEIIFGGGLDSILLPEGKHSLTASTSGVDLRINSFNYIGGHEYFIDYVSATNGERKRVVYWVKDLTEDKVVLRKEKTIEELKN